jgi:hypothetical protein
MLTMWHPLSAKVGTNFTDKQRSLCRSRNHDTEFKDVLKKAKMTDEQWTKGKENKVHNEMKNREAQGMLLCLFQARLQGSKMKD